MTQYTYNYFTRSDGIASWRAKSLKFGDAMAALCYAYGITWDQLVAEFPEVFAQEKHGKSEKHAEPYLEKQIEFLKKNSTRTPKKVLEIGGGRGEVTAVLGYLGVDVTSVEISPDAVKLYLETSNHFFGPEHRTPFPISTSIKIAAPNLDFSEFDTIIMVESLEHIPAEDFDPVWDLISQDFHGRFITVNWIDYHPIAIGQYASPQEHCRLVDDALYDLWTSQATTRVHRNGSHLVLDF